MFVMSTGAANIVSVSHTIDVRVLLTHPVYGNQYVPVGGGQVVVDAKSKVRRTAQISVDPRLWPDGTNGLIAPFGTTCGVEYGVVVPNEGTQWVPLGQFSLDNTSRKRPITGDAGVPIKMVDFSARIAEDTFDSPQQTISGNTAVQEITRLAQRTFPAVEIIDQSGANNRVVPQFEMQADPWSDGIEKLADAIACEVAFDRLGRLLIRPVPTLNDAPVWTLKTGNGANITATSESLSRTNVFNRVIARGQRSDSVPPVTGIATNIDPLSATVYGGPFGRKTKQVTSPALTTTAHANAMAAAKLAINRGLSFDLTMEIITQPGLTSGDVVFVNDAAIGPGNHILDQVTIPLDPTTTMALVTRSDNDAS